MNTLRVRLPRFVMAALFALFLAFLSACYPLPTWGPGAPGYECFQVTHTVWLSERPVNIRYASETLGATICTMYRSTILSVTPFQGFNKMGPYKFLMNADLDGGNLRIDWSNAHGFEVEGGSAGQLCAATKFLNFTCSFNDHVHLFFYYTVPGGIGLNGLYYTTDRGDISVWFTP